MTRIRFIALVLLLSLASTAESIAKTSRPPDHPSTTVSDDRSLAADNLAEQVAAIANSSAISRAKKEKRISTTVRIAVVAATAYKKDPDEILGIAVALTQAAARAAPSYAEVIANAVSFAAPLAKIESAPGRIRTAAYAAAKAPKNGHKTSVATKQTPKPASVMAEEESEPIPGKHTSKPVAHEEPVPESTMQGYAAESAMLDESSTASKGSLGGNSKFSVTADLSVRHDDNVYLSPVHETGDTITAITPGVEFRFGQNSLAHGSVNYKTAFTSYAEKTAPNVSLGSGFADFGYDSGSLAINAAAVFAQTNENTNEVAALVKKEIFRRDQFDADANIESHLTAKTSVKTGVNYTRVEYKSPDLTGSQETEIPLKVYFETTPKVSAFAGLAYRRVTPLYGSAVTPPTGDDTGTNWDYNIGARGNFTAKLSGEFSLDYRTRKVGDSDNESLWGMNGTLHYEITPKTTSSLAFSRDFSVSAFGESLINSSYAFHVTTDLTPQWILGANLSYRQSEYGPFKPVDTATPVNRKDSLWEGNLQATYLFRSWLSASADFTFRRNHSNLPLAEYSDNVISLMLGWRY